MVTVLLQNHLSKGFVSVYAWLATVVTLWHLNSQTVPLLVPLENDIGGRHSCVTICFLVIVPPVQVAVEWRQSGRLL